MLRWMMIGAAAVVASSTCGVAAADPPAPRAGTSCTSAVKDALTLPAGATVPLACDGTSWEPVADPYPISDEWLSYGPALTLHGQGRRNPMLESGDWTATPLSPATSCGATQYAVVSGTPTLGPPRSDQGGPGESLTLEVVPRLFTIDLIGDCLWQKSS